MSGSGIASGNVSIVGGDADDVLTLTSDLGHSLRNGTINGGAGVDTLRLVSPYFGYYDLSDLAVFSGIEIIRGSADDDTIWLRYDQFASVATIDGGANSTGFGENILGLRGTNLDLRSRTLLNIDRISVASDNAVITVADKALALKVTAYAQNDHLILEGAALDAAELQMLHSKGVDKITHAGGVSINQKPLVTGLDGTAIRILPGQTTLLDIGADAAITDDDGVVKSLAFRFVQEVLPNENIGFDTSGSVKLSDGLFDNSKISVDGIQIGSITQTSGSGFSVSLTGAATSDLVSKLVRAVTYVNTSSDSSFAAYREILITASDGGQRKGTAAVAVTIAQPGVIVLTSNVDNIGGTGADEMIVAESSSINPGDVLIGGDGFDTLQIVDYASDYWEWYDYNLTTLGDLRGIEKLQGSDLEETFHLGARELASFSVLDGGRPTYGDELVLHGLSVDLRNKAILNFDNISLADDGASLLISDASLADLVDMHGSENIHVILDGKTFSNYQIMDLLESGAARVTDASGTYTLSSLPTPTTPTTPSSPQGTPGADNLFGRPIWDSMIGYAGDDTIRGGGGDDALFGDYGNDLLHGEGDHDLLLGGYGQDRLDGGDGDDDLFGEFDNDVLNGGTGKDNFAFDTKPHKKTNLDKIEDFKVKDDSIWLDNMVFTKLGKKGSESSPAQLNKKFFTVGTKAKDKNDYVIYDNKKGILYYDADGSGKTKQVEFATLSKKLKMTYKDFFII